ncbi:uncharacterized protein PRCAT00004901001 [Priceomyces carsonii]|uniref:uncharacterized protein n=1 Tax=Priceomyces carsonii TaxID=28549 RepID=UPI002EDA3C83|nr:unnamed protein product [Priceomyces carsonii]
MNGNLNMINIPTNMATNKNAFKNGQQQNISMVNQGLNTGLHALPTGQLLQQSQVQQQQRQPRANQDWAQPPQTFNQNAGPMSFSQDQAFSPTNLVPNSMNGQMGNMVRMSQPQLLAQQMQSQQQSQQQRPAMLRAATFQQISPNAPQYASSKFHAGNAAVSAPNSAPLPSSGNPTMGSRNGTPRIASRPHPGPLTPQIQGQLHNGTVMQRAMPQQQPTPQIPPHPAPPLPHQQHKSILIAQIPLSGQTQPMMQGQPVGPNVAFGKSPDQGQLQNELNSKIFKRNLGNAAAMRILELVDYISQESIENLSNIDYWTRIIKLHTLPTFIFRFMTAPSVKELNLSSHDFLHGFSSSLNEMLDYNMEGDIGSVEGLEHTKSKSSRQYELNTVTTPRFLLANILEGNLAKFQLSFLGLKFQVLNNGSTLIFGTVTSHYSYRDGSISHVTGNCKILLSREFKIEWIDYRCLNNKESVSFDSLERHWKTFKEYHQNDFNDPSKDFLEHLYGQFEALKTSQNSGINQNAMRIMQISDHMLHLTSLMNFSVMNNINSPLRALELYFSNSNNDHTNNVMPQNNVSTSASPLSPKKGEDQMMAGRKRGSVVSMAGSTPMATDTMNGTNKRRK